MEDVVDEEEELVERPDLDSADDDDHFFDNKDDNSNDEEDYGGQDFDADQAYRD
jgi:hypothetical protein